MAESSVESAANLVRPKGSNIDIDKQGKLDSVKVDGELVPVDKGQAASDAGASSGGDAANTDVEPSGISESVNRLLDASIDVWNNFLEHLPYVLLAFAVFVLIVFLAGACKAGSRKLCSTAGSATA